MNESLAPGPRAHIRRLVVSRLSSRRRVVASSRRSSGRKPVLGLAGGIGAGKSAAAAEFARLGCAVIDSDEQARRVMEQPEVVQRIRRRWPAAMDERGRLDRKKMAELVFNNADERARLNALIHPLVHRMRRRRIEQLAADGRVAAIVLDTPLLFEAGVSGECDAVVFVDAPIGLRRRRVARARGWDADELDRRQRSQMDLDAKRARCDFVITNSGSRRQLAAQVRAVLDAALQRMKAKRQSV